MEKNNNDVMPATEIFMLKSLYDMNDNNIVDNAEKVNGHTVETNVPEDAVFTDTKYDMATESASGLMSSTDKAKLNGISEGATKVTVIDNITSTSFEDALSAKQGKLLNDRVADLETLPKGDMFKSVYDANNNGIVDLAENAQKVNGFTVEKAVPGNAEFTDTTYSNATSMASGLMSKEDKVKLDGISQNANSITIADNLISLSSDEALSAKQGKILNDRLVSVESASYGDMFKSVYDTNDDGKIDKADYADNAGTVNGLMVEKAVPLDAVFTDTKYSAATTSSNGLLSSADKQKLDRLNLDTSKNLTVANATASYFKTNTKPGGLISSDGLKLLTRTSTGNIALGQDGISGGTHAISLYAGGKINLCINNTASASNASNIEYVYADSKYIFRNRANGTCYLGSGSYRWNTIYSKTGSVSTSDKRKKYDINSITKDKKIEKFFEGLRPVSYKSVEGDGNRVHYGFIAQEIEENIENAGLKYSEFAPIVKTPVDKDGEELDYYNESDREKIVDYEYGLRYEEFISINTMMIQKLMNEVTELKKELKELKNNK
ncbi:tail fiber domain-containing protein [uncultured Anaerofustis sp.]|uniref:tail fiber domain-containing protein n=1 Tax=uncultured Anaerofustis sp. TaxID=904996 RepID=UPI0025E58121|nr:tail fiber domain-containing protein [uncultured Anaerofustis sp.]